MDYLFETDRLRVRAMIPDDAERLYAIHAEDAVRRWFPNECYADVAEARDAAGFFADCVREKRLPYVLAVELKSTGELIGDTGISEVEGRPEETEIGYVIGEAWRGKGCATELVRAMTAFAARQFGSRVIWGRVLHGNAASARVLEKSGYAFVREESGAEDDPYGNGMLVYRKDG